MLLATKPLSMPIEGGERRQLIKSLQNTFWMTPHMLDTFSSFISYT